MITALGVWLLGLCCSSCSEQAVDPGLPNFVIIFTDDVGYGDLGVYGHPTILTPNLDRLAQEGQKWTNFYASSCVCTPSRAGLITGRLPVRSGMCSNRRRVLFPDSEGGLPSDEVTIAEALKEKGYASACIGKWHLGHHEQYLPTNNGFDYYFGIPYSNDMDLIEGIRGYEACRNPKVAYFQVPLMRNTEILERPAGQEDITKRYAEEAAAFIEEHKDGPFFVYLAHTMAHVPLFASVDFRGTSRRGIYGDVLEEIDWSVGLVVEKLKEHGLEKNTLLVFTSDNGPWLIYETDGGSAGLLRSGKGCTYEGGMREPGIFWWPGKIQPAVIAGMGSTLDLFPTLCSLAGIEMPGDRIYDGHDLSPTLFALEESPRNTMIYYDGTRLFAIREGVFKAHFTTREKVYEKDEYFLEHDPPLLFNLEMDPGENYNVAGQHPEVIERLRMLAEEHMKTVKPVDNQLEKRSE